MQDYKGIRKYLAHELIYFADALPQAYFRIVFEF